MLAVAFAASLATGCGGGSGDVDAVAQAGNAAEIRKAYVADGGVELNPPAIAAVSGSNALAASSASPSGAAAVSNDMQAPTSGAAVGTGGTQDRDQAQASDAVDPTVRDFADEALAAINAARAQSRTCGDKSFPAAPPLRWNVRAAYAAWLEVEWMQKANAFGHEWPTGEHVWHRLEMSGYPWSRADENIAAGFRSLAAAMQGWIDSPPHCVALMRADVTEVGVAVVPGASHNTYQSYWAMVLAAPRSGAR